MSPSLWSVSAGSANGSGELDRPITNQPARHEFERPHDLVQLDRFELYESSTVFHSREVHQTIHQSRKALRVINQPLQHLR